MRPHKSNNVTVLPSKWMRRCPFHKRDPEDPARNHQAEQETSF